MRTLKALAALGAAGALLSGCSSSEPQHGSPSPKAVGSTGNSGAAKGLPWSRPANQEAQVKAAGLSLSTHETLTVHYHAHLDVFVNGATVPVPAGLGINIGANGKAPPHGAPGIAPLHTHDESGVLHIEAPKEATFTLGQVFIEWNIALNSDEVGSYPIQKVLVDGKAYDGDPAGIVLRPHEEIAVVAGTGNADAPQTYQFPAGE